MVDLSATQSFDASGNELLDAGGNSIPSALDFTEGSVLNVAGLFLNPGFIVEAGGPLDGSAITLTMPGYAPGIAGTTQPAVGNSLLFGFDVPTMMGGTVTLEVAAVPVPAAAWLFGSALVGLAGIGRNRK